MSVGGGSSSFFQHRILCSSSCVPLIFRQERRRTVCYVCRTEVGRAVAFWDKAEAAGDPGGRMLRASDLTVRAAERGRQGRTRGLRNEQHSTV